MDAKLTLKLDRAVIERAKSYAKKRNTSLSKLIESYLGMLVQPSVQEEVTPLVKSLSGKVQLPEKYDRREEYHKHLNRKYKR
jgi:hypothetical protein